MIGIFFVAHPVFVGAQPLRSITLTNDDSRLLFEETAGEVHADTLNGELAADTTDTAGVGRGVRMLAEAELGSE